MHEFALSLYLRVRRPGRQHRRRARDVREHGHLQAPQGGVRLDGQPAPATARDLWRLPRPRGGRPGGHGEAEGKADGILSELDVCGVTNLRK